MTRRWIGLVIVSVGVSVAFAGSAVVAAQDLLPCQPLAPGARCSAKPSANVWRLDFGAPKPAPAPPQDSDGSYWDWAARTHHGPTPKLMSVPPLEVPGLLDHPVDCKMAKPGDSAADRKIIAPHPGHTMGTGAARIVTVAPCKSK